MKRINFMVCAVLFLSLICACAVVQKQDARNTGNTEASEETAERTERVTRTEEEKKSLEVFMQILEIVESTDDRQSVLPRIENLYEKIIKEYPGAPLAQESYWKLISIYVNDYDPPEYEKAEVRYREFRAKYPGSVLKDVVSTTLASSYYKHREWKRLKRLCAPLTGNQQDGGNLNASLLFKCADADYNLGNTAEAVRNYRAVAELYPESNFGKKAGLMVEKIKELEKDIENN